MAVLKVPQQFPTIQLAVFAAAPGDVILVDKGIYNEQVLIPSKNNIRLIAVDDHVILDGEFSLGIAFTLNSVAGVEIKGFKIKRYLFVGIRIPRGRLNYIVDNCITQIDGDGISIIQSEGNFIWKNTIRWVNDGIVVSSADFNRIKENCISSVSGNGISSQGIGTNNAIMENTVDLSLVQGISGSGNNLIYKNMLSQNFDAAISNDELSPVLSNKVTENFGNGIESMGINVFISDNEVDQNQGTGILHSSGSFATIEENHVTGNKDNGIWVLSDRNLIFRNKAKDNTPFDLIVASPNNNISCNKCEKSIPPELCFDE